MIKKIFFAGIFLCLMIAIPLAVMGYTRVELGPSFMAFMKQCSNDLNDFKIGIPAIPKIPAYGNAEASGFLEVLINILDALIGFVNMITSLINIITTVVNVVISVIQFIVIVVLNLVGFKNNLATQPII